MRFITKILLPLVTTLCAGASCHGTETIPASGGGLLYRGHHVQTLAFGVDDNSEVIKLLPTGDLAVLVASKARKITLLGVGPDGLTELRTAKLFPEDASDSELTHIDFDSQGRFAVVTRTLPLVEGEALVDCRGTLVFVDVSDTDSFGGLLGEVAIGPMPDAVDISPDDRFIVTADEVDYNDGKCPLDEVQPTVSVLEIPGGVVQDVRLRAIITMEHTGEGARREPEQVIIASDNDHVGVTLQDTHEVLLFSISEVISDAASPTVLTSADLKVLTLPNRASGAEPWPDGINVFVDATGSERFVVAGEYNDTLTVLDLEGQVLSNHEIQVSDMPGDLPRNLESWSHAPFRPDSVASFQRDGHSYLATSLKHSGAVGVWLADDPTNLELAHVVKVGFDDGGDATTESTIGTEGISANGSGVVITANEGESSVSLVRPLGE